MKLKHLAFALAGVAACPVHAGEYSTWAPGFQLEYARGMNTSPGRPQGAAPDYLPQSLPLAEQAGLGVVLMLRPSELVDGALSNFQIPFTVGFRYGRGKDTSSLGSYSAFINGGVSTLSGTQAYRKTSQQDLYLYVPLRFYPGGNGATQGGFWLEAGPQLSNIRQTTDLTLTGALSGAPVSGSDSVTVKQNVASVVVGFGGTRAYYNSQFTFGLHYQANKSTQGAEATNMLRATLQWTF